MTVPAAALLNYLWHYMLARLLYDELVRDRMLAALLVVAVTLAGFVLRRRRRT